MCLAMEEKYISILCFNLIQILENIVILLPIFIYIMDTLVIIKLVVVLKFYRKGKHKYIDICSISVIISH